MRPTGESFLEVDDLRAYFPVEKGIIFRRRLGVVKAVDGVSLALRRGQIVGLVGESGCGKSTLGRAILQIIRPTSGRVLLEGTDLTRLEGESLRRARAHFQMIFQDPYASLNPRMTIGDTLREAIRAHRQVSRPETAKQIVELLSKVGLSQAAARKYPHEFSGGQRQRVAVARALAVGPKLIIADEPVSALDVSIQAQILNLISQLSRELGLTLIFIAHDLSVVNHISDWIAVMYLGRIVETGPAAQVYQRPLHPYTRTLISAVPIPDPVKERARQRLLLRGDPPSPMNPPSGCPFHPRCPWAVSRCAEIIPPFDSFDGQQQAACIRIREI